MVRETAYTFDAHFGQRAFRFDAEQIDYDPDIEKMNTRWYVQTPFGLSGVPPQHGGQDVTIGYDYDWVHFRINRECQEEDLNGPYGGNGSPNDPDKFSCYYKLSYNKYYDGHPEMEGMPYKHNNQKYVKDDAMDVVQFCRFMREERSKLQKFFNYLDEQNHPGDPAHIHDVADKTNTNTSAFRVEFSKEWYDWAIEQGYSEDRAYETARRYSIWVTCYVDEYYYEDDPINPIYGGKSDGFITQGNEFWKKFCNQPDRMMFILCSNDFSKDDASDYTGSVISIIQHSIQTPYNRDREELKSAWGTEITDETSGFGWFYAKGGPKTNPMFENTDKWTIPNTAYIPLPRNSTNNGLFNSASNWLFTSTIDGDKIEYPTGNSRPKWEDYLDYEAVNDLPYVNLKDDENHRQQTLRMACLMRNRDLNGDSYIDPEEIRWYMASTEQLYGLFLGGNALTEEAQTFTKATANKTGYYNAPEFGYNQVDAWREHIVSSSIYDRVNSGSETAAGKTLPHVMLAEEGAGGSPGAYRSDKKNDSGKKQARYTTRCIRNLGLPDATREDLSWDYLDDESGSGSYKYTNSEKIPTPLVSAKLYNASGEEISDPQSNVAKNGYYVFDCDNIDPRALRFKSTVELEPSDQVADICRLYRGFQTGPIKSVSRDTQTLINQGIFTQDEIDSLRGSDPDLEQRPTSYDVLYKMLVLGKSPCPEGYRVPNLRELTVMILYGTSTQWWTNQSFICGTWTACGYNYGNKKDYISTGNKDEKLKDTWRVQRTSSTAFTYSLGGTHTVTNLRCVRDIDPE